MTPKKESPTDFEASQKKRKWDHSLSHHEFFKDHQTHDHPKTTKSIFDIELHLNTPLPSDKWQQYLTLQVHIHTYIIFLSLYILIYSNPDDDDQPANIVFY